MHKGIVLCLVIILFVLSPITFANQFNSRQLEDGSQITENKSSDGKKIVQIKRPNGVMERVVLDSDGDQMVTTTYPDGRMEMKSHSS